MSAQLCTTLPSANAPLPHLSTALAEPNACYNLSMSAASGLAVQLPITCRCFRPVTGRGLPACPYFVRQAALLPTRQATLCILHIHVSPSSWPAFACLGCRAERQCHMLHALMAACEAAPHLLAAALLRSAMPAPDVPAGTPQANRESARRVRVRKVRQEHGLTHQVKHAVVAGSSKHSCACAWDKLQQEHSLTNRVRSLFRLAEALGAPEPWASVGRQCTLYRPGSPETVLACMAQP